jgi:hypothetical protein
MLTMFSTAGDTCDIAMWALGLQSVSTTTTPSSKRHTPERTRPNTRHNMSGSRVWARTSAGGLQHRCVVAEGHGGDPGRRVRDPAS